ncbi:hypothetical protein AK88_04690 [Plasmodium fragile]|uniref:Uncharacterized protein n=1 Tax=Plasmodium fragile TaxID=5857 RepID=A0A0D9QF92_PLAFR|nr:uncharacterized protein AK88_04690 [Plasmodium fragile]KJP85659.1 hypothetical protein AK88_04690 [Plasmodium fragile]
MHCSINIILNNSYYYLESFFISIKKENMLKKMYFFIFQKKEKKKTNICYNNKTGRKSFCHLYPYFINKIYSTFSFFTLWYNNINKVILYKVHKNKSKAHVVNIYNIFSVLDLGFYMFYA